MNVDLDALTSAYVSIRDARAELLKKYEESDEELKQQLLQLEQALLSVCNEVNADSIRTAHGTIMRQLKERFVCGDWDPFKDFIRENGLVDLLEKRIHQGNFKQFMADHPDDGLPPGVNALREYGISVRRSSK